jgi:hypothetical protein
VYDARLHPEWAAAGKLLLSYNINSLDFADNMADARLYRPRFAEVIWPPPPLTGLPAAPAALTATADTEGGVRLSWTAVAGATGYRIHRRDVAAGQSHFVRLPATVTGTTYQATGLSDGHLYEFSVSAVNAAGEGGRGIAVTAIARTTPGEAGGRAIAAPAPARTTPAEPGVFQTAPDGSAVAGEYLVDLKDNAADGERGMAAIAARLVDRYGGTLDGVFAAVLGGFAVTGMTDAQARALAADPAVAAVEESILWTRVCGPPTLTSAVA